MAKKDRVAKKSAEDYGSSLKFDPDFNGPLRNRSCTDVLCLLLFIAFLAGWGVVAFFAFKYGDPARLLNPTDSTGRRCGVDEDVIDKKFLLFFDLTKCTDPSVLINGCNTPQVCVSQCPTKAFYVRTYGPLLNTNFTELKEKLICIHGFNVNEKITSFDSAVQATDKEECAPYYFTSISLHGRCIPLKAQQVLAPVAELGNMKNSWFTRLSGGRSLYEASSTTTLAPSLQHQHQVEASYRALFKLTDIGQMVVEDLTNSWGWICGLLGIAMIACFIFIVLMRWFAGVMVWISLIGVHAALSYSIYACWKQWDYLKKNPPTTTAGLTIEEQAKSLLAMEDTWLAFMIISSILLVIVFLLTIFLRSRIRIAVALIGEASKAVGSVTSTLVFPLVPWVLQCGIIAWTVVLIFYLASSGKEVFKVTGLGNGTSCTCNGTTYQDGTICSMLDFSDAGGMCSSCPSGHCRFFRFVTEPYVNWLQAANIFGFFWAVFFVSAIGEMILAGTFATWYWTYDKSNVPFFTLTEAAGRTFRYNLGTLAFGSLIIAICRMIRVALEFINNQLKKYDNICVKCVMCCCRCFFWCLESFIKFINRNAYIMCAVHGKNFCASAKDAFGLLMRNIVRVVVLDKVTDFLLLLGKLLITSGICSLAFFLFSNQLQVENVPGVIVPQLNYSLMPVFIVGFGTFFIATLFFSVYAMAVDTLFLCFLEDSERNDGSVEKPYFMSKDLRQLLGKKNKSS